MTSATTIFNESCEKFTKKLNGVQRGQVCIAARENGALFYGKRQ